MFDLVLKNGSIFFGHEFFNGDLAVTGEKIAAIGKDLSGKNEIDCSGKWVLPGAIDVHTHFSLPFAGAISADDFFSGTRAGAFGGVTSIIDFTAQKGEEGLKASFERRLNEAQGNACVDFSFHSCIGRFSKEVKDDFAWLPDSGIPSLKVFMAYGKAGMMQSDENLLEIMKLCKLHDILLTVHAENGAIIDSLTEKAELSGKLGIEMLPETRPVFTEVEAIRRIADLSRATACPVYVVHVSSGEGADVIRAERSRGTRIFGESCPQYLYLDNTKFREENGHYFGCCPPIREKEQQQGLWKNLDSADISVMATDHCPFTKANKDLWNNKITELPMGLGGIETLPALVLWGAEANQVNIASAIKSITENPARIFGMYPEKGSLIPGTDADIMVFNPQKEHLVCNDDLHMNSDYSVFEGVLGKGWNEITIARGRILVQDNKWLGEKGYGKFIKRSQFSFPKI